MPPETACGCDVVLDAVTVCVVLSELDDVSLWVEVEVDAVSVDVVSVVVVEAAGVDVDDDVALFADAESAYVTAPTAPTLPIATPVVMRRSRSRARSRLSGVGGPEERFTPPSLAAHAPIRLGRTCELSERWRPHASGEGATRQFRGRVGGSRDVDGRPA